MPRPLIQCPPPPLQEGLVQGGLGLLSALALKLGFPLPQREEQAEGRTPKLPKAECRPELSGTLLGQSVSTEHPDSGTQASGSQQVPDKCHPPGVTQAQGLLSSASVGWTDGGLPFFKEL